MRLKPARLAFGARTNRVDKSTWLAASADTPAMPDAVAGCCACACRLIPLQQSIVARIAEFNRFSFMMYIAPSSAIRSM
jgi:hypothetical protein